MFIQEWREVQENISTFLPTLHLSFSQVLCPQEAKSTYTMIIILPPHPAPAALMLWSPHELFLNSPQREVTLSHLFTHSTLQLVGGVILAVTHHHFE